MDNKRRETEINGVKYIILLPPVRKVMPLCTRVSVLLTPILGTLGKDIKEGGMGKFADAVKSIDPDKLDAIFMRAVEISTLHAGTDTPIFTEIDFERHFDTHRDSVYQVMLWVLWECTRDFFPQVGGFAQKFKEKFAKEFQSQMDGETTTG